MHEVVIVEAGRSPVGKRNGSLGGTHPTDLLGQVMMGVLDRAGIDSADVDQVLGGCINKVGAQAMNVTRTAWLAHGGDEQTACITVDSQCGSSQHAITLAHSLIASGMEAIVLACGVENMTLLPIGADAVAGAKAGMGKPIARSYREHYEFANQFEGAERIAEKYQISRQETDAFGLESQLRAAKAVEEGRFEAQIIPIESPLLDSEGKRTSETFTVTRDEVPRDTSLEALANLKPVAREDGIHTAGSSSQIADGAAAVLLMSAEKAAELGKKPLARIVDSVLVGCDPVLMLEGPIPATEELLENSRLSMADIDVVEINEAFASVVLAWAKAMGADLERVNPNGGAIALGHPLGGTGCVLITKAVHELHRTGGEYAIATMCCGGGLGTGTLVQRL